MPSPLFDENLRILLNIKDEYIKTLLDNTLKYYMTYFANIYNQLDDSSVSKRGLLRNFQKELEKVAKLSDSEKMSEFNNMKANTKFTGYDGLIRELCKSYTNLLVQITNKYNKSIDIDFSAPYIIHYNTLLEIARELWRNPDIFYNRDMTKYNKIVSILIVETIRKSIPFESLLNIIADNDSEADIPEEEEYDDDIPEEEEDDDDIPEEEEEEKDDESITSVNIEGIEPLDNPIYHSDSNSDSE